MGSDWIKTTLGNVIITNESTYSNKDKWAFINYLDTGNLTENNISEIQHLIVGEDKIPSRAKRKILPGDIIYSTVRPNQKHYGIIKNPPSHLLVSTGFVTIRAKAEIADTNFVYWFLVQPQIIEKLQIIGEHSTSAYPSIKPSDIEELKLNLPPLPEQKAIAHILGSLDDKIELNRRMNETLEAMAQAMFKSWFVDFDPVMDNALAAGNDIPEELQEKAGVRKSLGDKRKALPEEISRLFPSEFENSEEMGWIPKGWEVGNVGDVLHRLIVKRRYKKKDVIDYGFVPVYEQGSNILMGYHNGVAEIKASQDDPAFIFGDHTCVTKLSCESFSISENVIPLKGKIFSTYWVYYAIKDKQSFEEYRRHWMELIVKKIVLPSEENAKSYEKMIANKIEKQNFISNQISTIIKLRDTLLPKLLSGQLRIPQAEKLAEAAL